MSAADLHRQRQLDGLAKAHLHIGPIDRLESLQFRVDGVRAWRQKRNRESSFAIGDRGLCALRTGCRHGDAWHGESLRVDDPTGNRSGRVLSCRTSGDRTRDECDCNDPQSLHAILRTTRVGFGGGIYFEMKDSGGACPMGSQAFRFRPIVRRADVLHIVWSPRTQSPFGRLQHDSYRRHPPAVSPAVP